MGDDSNCVKVSAALAVATIYATGIVPFYFDSAEAVIFCWQNPSNTTCYACGAGSLLVDASDNAYGATFGMQAFSFAASNMTWANTKPLASSTTACFRTNYGSADRTYFQAWNPTGVWASSAVSSTDILTDTGANKAWFVPVQLLGQTKGEGSYSKCARCHRAGHSWPADCLQHDGLVVQARQANIATVGGNGLLWLTNFSCDQRYRVPHRRPGVRGARQPGIAAWRQRFLNWPRLRHNVKRKRPLRLACEDGMLVLDLRPGPEGLELFVWLAIAFRHGAYERQDAALLAIARDLGALTIAFAARRRGWARRLGPEWHRRGKDEFMRRVT